jgi:hypothetical protein
METLISIFIAIYIMQLVVFAAVIATDMQNEYKLPKIIATKKQALFYIIPLGFLYSTYQYYKKLD